MNILFFISHQPNPRFIKQLNFLSANNHVSLIFFERKTLANLNKSINLNIVTYNLGDIPNASSPLKRILTYIKAIKKIKEIVHKETYDTILVNNIDVLLLYVFSKLMIQGVKKGSKVAIEISDLRGFVFGKKWGSILMRYMERQLYNKYVDKLVVTSKKYYTYHFSKFYNKEIFVLENKLLASEIKTEFIENIQKSDKTIIGIVGLLLRKDEYIKLFETYKNSQDVEIHIHGKGHYQDLVEDYADRYNNIIFFGPYDAFRDAERIYKSLDIIYLVYDTNQISLNNKLALPNKLYECMYYRTPILCSKDTYLEEIVNDLDIGKAIDYIEMGAIEQAVKYLMGNKVEILRNFNKVPKDSYLGDKDYEQLEVFLR